MSEKGGRETGRGGERGGKFRAAPLTAGRESSLESFLSPADPYLKERHLGRWEVLITLLLRSSFAARLRLHQLEPKSYPNPLDAFPSSAVVQAAREAGLGPAPSAGRGTLPQVSWGEECVGSLPPPPATPCGESPSPPPSFAPQAWLLGILPSPLSYVFANAPTTEKLRQEQGGRWWRRRRWEAGGRELWPHAASQASGVGPGTKEEACEAETPSFLDAAPGRELRGRG